MVYFISTPIGNLKDITLRALDVLNEADAIFCEDTRHTLTLLNAYDIKKPLYSCHKFNEREAAQKIAAAAKEGKNIAVVSDAGMPVISDPGNAVCQTLLSEGVPYTILPGANAALSALVLSAFDPSRFCFLGFLPEKKGERERALSQFASLNLTLIIHVAPQDLDKHIADMYAVLGERKACAVREITKLHEEAVHFMLSEGYKGDRRGEFVIVVEGKEGENPLNSLSEREHILHYINLGYEKMEAVKLAAKDRKVKKSDLYPFSVDL